MIARTSPCGGDVYVVGQPWCITVTVKGMTLKRIEFTKSANMEYSYGIDDKEEGPRADTAASKHAGSSVMVTFNTLQKDDMTEWTIKVDNSTHNKSSTLDLTSVVFLGE